MSGLRRVDAGNTRTKPDTHRGRTGRTAFRPTSRTGRSYSQHMAARVGGRNRAISWIVGLLCAGVVGGLLWFAVPAGPAVIEMVGTSLRQLAP